MRASPRFDVSADAAPELSLGIVARLRPGRDLWCSGADQGDGGTKMRLSLRLACGLFAALIAAASNLATAQPPSPSAKGYEVEWVYRVRYGFIDEWWDLFRKYQIPILDRAKALGYIIDYRVYHPQFHTDEAARWDYRIEITYADQAAGSHEEEIARELFPDTATRKREELRRWELTTNHWDLPIFQVDTTKGR